MELVKQQSVDRVPDLMGYLRQQFLQRHPLAACVTENVDSSAPQFMDVVDEFLEDCRTVMRENSAVGLDYLSQGMGIRLQDGTVLSWVELPPEPEGLPSVGSGLPVTQPKPSVFKQGVTPSTTFPVTGAKK